MFEGKLVRLRALTKEDLPRCVQWIGDQDVTQYLNFHRPISLEQEERWFDSILNDTSGRNEPFAIETLERQHIGVCGLHDIHARYRHAELGIFIGEKEYWGRGYGSEAVRLLLEFAFGQLNLHRVYLHVFASNERAVRAYEKCGFKREGLLRHHAFKNGRYVDVIIMGILADEFRALLAVD